MHRDLPPGITLVQADGFQEWLCDIEVYENPLYLNQMYRLKFGFSSAYPIGQSIGGIYTISSPIRLTHNAEAPEVTFQLLPDRPIPIHPHVYSNGYICLDLLGPNGWSPVQNVVSVCVSIQSMLSGNSKAERPEGDADFVRNNRKRPRDVSYVYHEDV